MQFSLIGYTTSKDLDIDDETFSCDIVVNVKADSDLMDDFPKLLTVVSNNKQTRYEVLKQRADAIQQYINALNK